MEVSVAEAKARHSEVIKKAERGGEVVITRRGKPVATITGVKRRLKPLDLTRVDALRARLKPSDGPSSVWLRRFRDEARF